MQLSTFIEKISFSFFKLLPVKYDIVLFKSFGGQYNDNPKYVSEKIHSMDRSCKLVWVTSEKSMDSNWPDYVVKVKLGSLKYFYYSSVAGTLVDNMNGIRILRNNKTVPFYYYFLKRKGQLNISTWHGTPLKKIGCDVKEYNISNYQTSSDFITVGNTYSHEIFKNAFKTIKIEDYGSPRNDILFDNSIDIGQLKKKLDLPTDKKVILYAPTFRSDVNESGLNQIKQINPEKLLACFKEKFGGEWCLVLRVHHEVLLSIRNECKNFVDNNFVYDGNAHDDMAEYLKAADVLLTDYSSSMFDYMLCNKPCFLFAFDRSQYINDERGVYFPIEELPFSFADSVDQLYDNIDHYDQKSMTDAINLFLKKVGNIDDGHSSERLANIIMKHREDYKHE